MNTVQGLCKTVDTSDDNAKKLYIKLSASPCPNINRNPKTSNSNIASHNAMFANIILDKKLLLAKKLLNCIPIFFVLIFYG